MTGLGLFEGKGQVQPLIECFRCGICCSDYQAILSMAEGQRIADKLELTPDEFQNRYTDKRWPGTKNFILRKTDGACVFLERTNGSNVTSCLIHPVRPSACRAWVPGLHRRECQAGLARYWSLRVSPAGSVAGTPERVQEFCRLLESLATCNAQDLNCFPLHEMICCKLEEPGQNTQTWSKECNVWISRDYQN